MKHIISTILLLIIATIGWSQDQRFDSANKLYTNSEFDEAIIAYEEILKSGVEHKSIYFNLGNTYYKKGNLPKAILNFERAKLLDPDDDDVIYNLELANSLKIDKIETVGQFFLSNWTKGLINMGSSNFWATISAISFSLLLLLLALFLFSRIITLKRASFFIGILTAIIFIFSTSFSSIQKNKLVNRNTAIVFSPSVTVNSSPDNSGTELFVLHEGTKVKILETLGSWKKIELSDGSQGWMPSVALEII